MAKKGLPAQGVQFSYKANVATAGKYDLWLREGYEFVRAPLDWRVNGGEWSSLGCSNPPTGDSDRRLQS